VARERRLQRLPEDTDTIRRGAIDKGETRRRRSRRSSSTAAVETLLGEGDTLKAERNAASKRIGEAIKAGPGRTVRRSRT